MSVQFRNSDDILNELRAKSYDKSKIDSDLRLVWHRYDSLMEGDLESILKLSGTLKVSILRSILYHGLEVYRECY